MSTIRTVDRTFAILRIVANHPQGIGVTKIAKELSLAKSTVSRLLATMLTWGVVEKLADQQYCIGPEPARWVNFQTSIQSLAQQMLPTLQTIANASGEATALCILEGNQLLYQEYVQSHQDIQMRDWRGERIPPHAVAPGKVLLAYAEEEALAAYLATPLVSLTKKTVTDIPTLRTQLKVIREEGFAIADEEFGEGIVGMAVPLADKVGQVVASLCVYGPKFRLNSLTAQMAIIEMMQGQIK